MQNKRLSKKTTLLSLVIIVSVVAIGLWIYNQRSSSQGNVVDGVNYNPPTEEEKKAGDERKEEIDDEEAQRNQPTDTSQKKGVSVIITDAGQYDDVIEVRSFIPGYLQDGTCTISFTKGDQTFTKETPAKADVSTTICLNPNISRSEFPSTGSWTLAVTYNSQNASGESEAKIVDIK